NALTGDVSASIAVELVDGLLHARVVAAKHGTLAHSPVHATLPVASALPTRVQVSFAPNPVRGQGRMSFVLPQAGPARIEVFEITGRKALVLLDAGRLEAGVHQLVIPTSRLDPGVYFYRLQSGTKAVSGRF